MLVIGAGSRHVWGTDFPVDESAFVGGSHSLRGYRHSRYAGRTSAFASAELRLPLFELEIFTRGRFGVLGFQDVARVWWDEEESDTWHLGHGGGIWNETLGFLGRAMIAKGEEVRYYLGLETPF
jgi:outer membrane protein assembly factor BamA